MSVVSTMEGPAEERLVAVLKKVSEEDLARHDATFDAWASHEPEILPLVREVQRARYQFVRMLFEEAGFSGEKLALRTQAFLGFMKYRSSHPWSWRGLESPGGLDEQLAFFLRK